MKYALVAVALAAFTQARTLDNIPSCALPCLDMATQDCKNFGAVQGAATSCIVEKCGARFALDRVLPAAQALCKAQNGGGSSKSATSTAPNTQAPASPDPTKTVQLMDD